MRFIQFLLPAALSLALPVAEAPASAADLLAPAPKSSAQARVEQEATAFMAAYARELAAGDRAAIAERYDRSGAWRVGNGEKMMQSWAEIRDFYAGDQWGPPASFAWRDLSYEVLGRDVVIVVGLFDWGVGAGKPPVTVSYTGLLVRRGGALKIRLEDESAARREAGGN